MFGCITKYAVKGCLVVLLSMLKGMFGCITKYA